MANGYTMPAEIKPTLLRFATDGPPRQSSSTTARPLTRC